MINLNQILDHNGPQKSHVHRNPKDTEKIIRVYAFLIILFALCFIGKGAYSIYENNKIMGDIENSSQEQGPQIVLNADNDILSIESTYSAPIESIAYQWYRGNVTADEIENYEAKAETASDNSDTSDDEVQESDDEIKALGKGDFVKGNGDIQMRVDNIGIPKGNTTILVTVTARNNVVSKFVQSYYTEVGEDRIAPTINVKVQGKTLLVTATDETEISKLIYSVNGGNEEEVTDGTDSKTIKATIPISDTEENEVVISAVDKANNTGSYNQTFDIYSGTPKIEFSAEDDYSKIYAKISYGKGIKRIEYELNGEKSEKEFDNPADVKEYEIELDSKPGHNVVTVKAYAQEEDVYAEESGECDYNP